jgi:membrane associated rhomboid family serine protease
MSTPSPTPITRGDLETKLREVSGDFGDTVEAAQPQHFAGAAAGLLLAVIVAYLLGRRRGRKRSAVVEIRRV